MTIHPIYIGFTLVVILSACSLSGNQEERKALTVANKSALYGGVSDPISLDIENALQKKLRLSELLEENYRLIPLETHEHCLIGNIDKILFKDHFIYVFDSTIARQVFQFDNQGNFIRKVGMRGRGPGEIDIPLDFDVYENHVYILDRQSRIFKFDQEGNFMKVELLPFQASQMSFLDSGSLLIYTHEQNLNNNHHLIQLNAEFEIITEDFPILNKNLEFIGSQQSFSSGPFGIMFSKFYSDTLYQISDGNMQGKYVINGGNSKKEIGKLGLEEIQKESLKSGSLNHWSFAENSSHLVFTFIQGPEIHYGIYNRKEEKVWRFKSIQDDFFLGAFSFMHVIGMVEDFFVFQIYPEIWSEAYRSIITNEQNHKSLDKIKDGLNKNLKGIPEIESSQNPILLVSKIKG